MKATVGRALPGRRGLLAATAVEHEVTVDANSGAVLGTVKQD